MSRSDRRSGSYRSFGWRPRPGTGVPCGSLPTSRMVLGGAAIDPGLSRGCSTSCPAVMMRTPSPYPSTFTPNTGAPPCSITPPSSRRGRARLGEVPRACDTGPHHLVAHLRIGEAESIAIPVHVGEGQLRPWMRELPSPQQPDPGRPPAEVHVPGQNRDFAPVPLGGVAYSHRRHPAQPGAPYARTPGHPMRPHPEPRLACHPSDWTGPRGRP